jgi:hypothetical protein
MVIDTAHGHIFFGQGSASEDSILVTTLTRQSVTTIPGQDRADFVHKASDRSNADSDSGWVYLEIE